VVAACVGGCNYTMKYGLLVCVIIQYLVCAEDGYRSYRGYGP
jgi:hypothetical protein